MKTFQVGQTVYWQSGKLPCEGIVRDDFEKETIPVLCIRIGEKKAYQKINVKRGLITLNDDKMDIKKKLLENKFKKYSKAQLFDKLKKGKLVDLDIEVIEEILIGRGVSKEEIEAIYEPVGVEVEEDKIIDVKSNNTQPVIKQPNVYQAEPEQPLTDEEKKLFKENTQKPKRVSKSVELKVSNEVQGLQAGVKVSFKPSPRLKIEGEIIGEVIKVYKCHKAGFKEYCQIKGENGKVFYKRSNSLKLV
jgi:hypothetical protein